LATLVAVPRERMTLLQKQALRSLHAHFVAADDEGSESEPRPRVNPRKRQRSSPDGPHEDESDDGYHADEEDVPEILRDERRHPLQSQVPKRHPWQAFLNLTSVELPLTITIHIRKHGTDPKIFLNDDMGLVHRIAEFGAITAGDAYMACCSYTLRLDNRRTKDNIRWCFAMLGFFDILKLIRPIGSGRVGQVMAPDIVRFLGPVLGKSGRTPEEDLRQLKEWCRYGSKLDKLCAELGGSGFLFFLDKQLSRDL
jgi:hypothetical protein